MTNKELIERLQEFPMDAEVNVETEYGFMFLEDDDVYCLPEANLIVIG